MDDDVSPMRWISAVTLVTSDMDRSVEYYTALGFEPGPMGSTPEFTSLVAGSGFLNLQLDPRWTPRDPVWGRVIIWVDDVDEVFARALHAGLEPEAPPTDAPWGERYFHIRDPDGHELSFAVPLRRD